MSGTSHLAPDNTMTFDIDQIQDYIQSLCHRHKEIKHDVDGIKSFARFQSEEEMTSLRNNAGKNVVVVAAINGRRVGDKDERTLHREMILRIVSYAENNTAEEIKAALKTAEEIMFDLITEMEHQQEKDMDEDVCGIMDKLQPENFSWEEVEDQPWLINHYGWDLTVPFKVYMPAHNAAKWEEE